MFTGIEFDGEHSYTNKGFTMDPEREIGIPNKIKTKIQVPFSSVVYDFSDIYGSQDFEERTLKYKFNIAGRKIKTKNEMNVLKTKLINWLMKSGGKKVLRDDNIKGYYFLAELEGNSSFKENWKNGLLEVEFTAYPFMISELPEGHDIWDDFNFELDVSQPVNYQVSGKRTIKFINAGIYPIRPDLLVTGSVTLSDGVNSITLNDGLHKSVSLLLKTGGNIIQIDGLGTVKIIAHKELI